MFLNLFNRFFVLVQPLLMLFVKLSHFVFRFVFVSGTNSDVSVFFLLNQVLVSVFHFFNLFVCGVSRFPALRTDSPWTSTRTETLKL